MRLLRELGPTGLQKALEAEWSKENGYLGGVVGRKTGYAQRLDVDRDRHEYLIKQRIRQLYKTQDIQEEILQHTDTYWNILKRIADVVAIAYDVPPSRELRGAPEEQQREYLRALRESRIHTTAEQWGRYAFLMNVVHVLPRIEKSKLTWTTVLPHAADVIFGDDRKTPEILVWDTRAHGAKHIAVDAERYWWLDGNWRILHEEEHHLEMTPWVTFRHREAPEDDYWDRAAGNGLVKGTIELGRISAQLSWVRKNNSKKLPYLFLDAGDDLPPQQSLNSNDPLMARGDPKFGVVDNIVSVDEFLKEMSWIVDKLAEQYGIPSTEIDLAPRSTEDAANVYGPAGAHRHERLSKVRNRQIKYHEESERELAVRTCVLLRREGRMQLDEDQVREAFRIRFPPLSYTDHPKTQVEIAQAQMSIGATDPFEFYQTLHPGLTLAEAREEVLENIQARAEFFELVMRHNLPLDANKDALSVSQIQGALGGQRSGEVRRAAAAEEEEN